MFDVLTGLENFAELRQNGYYYVDKTYFLNEFLFPKLSAKVALFTRPRRFGKTLFMSMLAEFFDIRKKSRDLFAGLKVCDNEKLCNEWMNQYPVISLTLKGLATLTYADAVTDIQNRISALCTLHDDVLDNHKIKARDRTVFQMLMNCETNEITLRSSLLVLTRVLFQHYNKPVILLIDEYDTPVEKAFAGGYYNEMIVFMRGFLTDALKTNPYLKFGIVTGVLRITQQSLFSDINNLDCFDISEPLYSDLFGFTQNEVDQLLVYAGFEDKREEIKEWYDGYCFGKQQEIYCPWSIMKYLATLKKDPKRNPAAYWVGVSGSELPRDLAKRLPPEEDVQGKIAALRGGNAIAAKLNSDLNYVDVLKDANNFWTLLYLTGYLTRASNPALFTGEKNAKDSILAIPNKEVREVFQTEMEAWFKDILPENRQNALYQALWAQDVQGLEEQLTALLVGTSFHDAKESYYHGVMYGILAMRYGETISNGESGLGLYDIVVQDKKNTRAAVLEFKRASSAEQMDEGVRQALEQINRNDYDVRLRTRGCKTILHVGIAFCEKSARVGFEEA